MWAPVSTPARITAVLAAIAITAAITYHLARRRTAAYHRAALTAVVHAARRDDLTGLGNRTGLHAALADVAGRPVSVILINLDGTRAFVNRFGHRALDQLLVLTAGRLRHVASAAGGSAFRLRRDEFAVILDARVDAAGHAARLVAAVAEPTEIQLFGVSTTVTVTGCAGVAAFSPYADGDQRLALIRADRAMRVAKRAGRGQTTVFDPAAMRGLDGSHASHADGGEAR
ncbi:GGDEF domain-containing protein [Micromonospora sp. WMMC415]|uniref:GGDEF domain-containing protein n=1 Tax=Micromonospora sp. WMMC415 TaxID=2675222 RepID=UPI0018AFB4EE|nr:GGDEF domain-containing protein [Micromonospora sp. WMMC415]